LNAVIPNLDRTLGSKHTPRPFVLASRANRVLLLIPIIWMLNLIDLFFTVLASRDRGFVELNPIAADLNALGQLMLKGIGLLLFTVIFAALHRHRAAQWGCYFVLGVYSALVVVWFTLYGFLLSPNYLQALFVMK